MPARLAALAIVVLALAAGCGDDGEETSPPTTTETTTQTQATTTETTTEPAPEGPTVVRIRVVGGVPEGGIARETVEEGDRVVVEVRSDVADHVHVHGYDLFRDVAPGSPARIAFEATLPGRFEVELEDRHVQIAVLTVQP